MKPWRVSHVVAFREWEADEDADEAWLLSRLTGADAPTEAMMAGTAFHKALELAQSGAEYERIEIGEYTFRILGDFEVELGPVRELRLSKTYIVDGEPIVITGQVDHLTGRRIDDHKTTANFDADRYLSGYQWRLYLDIFKADRFRWNVFEIKFNEDEGCFDVRSCHRLEQCRYPALGADCQALVERFARYVRERVLAAA